MDKSAKVTTSLDLVSVAIPRVGNDRSALLHDVVTLRATRSDDLSTFGNDIGQTTFIRVKWVPCTIMVAPPPSVSIVSHRVSKSGRSRTSRSRGPNFIA